MRDHADHPAYAIAQGDPGPDVFALCFEDVHIRALHSHLDVGELCRQVGTFAEFLDCVQGELFWRGILAYHFALGFS